MKTVPSLHGRKARWRWLAFGLFLAVAQWAFTVHAAGHDADHAEGAHTCMLCAHVQGLDLAPAGLTPTVPSVPDASGFAAAVVPHAPFLCRALPRARAPPCF